MDVGDWIEHLDSPATRGIVVKRAGESLWVFVNGDDKPRLVGGDVLRHYWEPLYADADAALIPFSVKPEAIFIPRSKADNIARIHSTRPGWVAYWDHLDGRLPGEAAMDTQVPPRAPTFMILPWGFFSDRWAPAKPPTSWARLMEDDPCLRE